MEVNPNVFQHEISVKPEGNKYFPVVAMTNLDHAKMIHLAKGDIVGFTHDEEVEMHYIETTSVLKIDEVEQKAPRNWIPERRWRKYKNHSKISPQNTEVLEATHRGAESGKISTKQPNKYIEPSVTNTESEILRKELQEKEQHTDSRNEEGFETDFLISPGDVYPNRKVTLQDTEIDKPMQLICMDLVGPISPVTSRGNRFILTCIDMLTGFTVAILIKDKSTSTVCDAYRAHIYCTFEGSARILKDNGTEFKNKQMDELCKQLDIKRVYSPVYTPEAKGRLEAWHCFFKACVAKHIRGNEAEWDEVVPLAAAAYKFFPCQAAGESPFVLMFGRDPITPFAKLLEPAPRYWGDCGGHLKMDLLKKLYLLTAKNMK